jgi:hypothetical protein
VIQERLGVAAPYSAATSSPSHRGEIQPAGSAIEPTPTKRYNTPSSAYTILMSARSVTTRHRARSSGCNCATRCM